MSSEKIEIQVAPADESSDSEQEDVPAVSNGSYFYYFSFGSSTPARSVRKAQDPVAGTWSVFVAMGPDRKAEAKAARAKLREKFAADNPDAPPINNESDDEEDSEDQESVALRLSRPKPHERTVVTQLRSIKLADECIRCVEYATSLGVDNSDSNYETVQLLWSKFDISMIKFASGPRNYQTIFPVGSRDTRATTLMNRDLRQTILTQFGDMCCARKDVKAFAVSKSAATIVILAFIEGIDTPLLCDTFDVSQGPLAERTVAAYRRIANSQVLDPEIDFDDPRPVSVEQRLAERDESERELDASMSSQARKAQGDISKVTLKSCGEVQSRSDKLKALIDEANNADDDDDEDADVDDKAKKPKISLKPMPAGLVAFADEKPLAAPAVEPMVRVTKKRK